jgi:hypothetical protein
MFPSRQNSIIKRILEECGSVAMDGCKQILEMQHLGIRHHLKHCSRLILRACANREYCSDQASACHPTGITTSQEADPERFSVCGFKEATVSLFKTEHSLSSSALPPHAEAP